MNPLDVAHSYFDAWNRRDPVAIVATFAEGGIYDGKCQCGQSLPHLPYW